MDKKQIAKEFTKWITKEAPDFFEHFCKQSEFNRTPYWEYLENMNWENYICGAFSWTNTPDAGRWPELSLKWGEHIKNLEKKENNPKIKINGVELSQETVENIIKEWIKRHGVDDADL